MLILTPIDFVWYVPVYGGNRDRWINGQDQDPFMLEIRPPSYGDARAVAKQHRDGTVPEDQTREYVATHTRAVRGLRIGDEAITTATRLWELLDGLDPDLVKELYDALFERGRLDEGAKKN